MNQPPDPFVSLAEIIKRLARLSPDYTPELDLRLRRKHSAEVLNLLRERNTDLLCHTLWVDPDAVGYASKIPQHKDHWVPASTWGARKFDFRSGEFESSAIELEYRSARISMKEARQLWPKIFDDSDKVAPSIKTTSASATPTDATGPNRPSPASSAGRKRKYDEVDFLILCAWEASANELPDKQSVLMRRMDELLQVIWGENQTPGETWLKEHIRRLYAARDRYESGRRACPGE